MKLQKVVVLSKQKSIQQLTHNISDQVFGADNPYEAVDIIQSNKPNLIVFDKTTQPDDLDRYVPEFQKYAPDTPILVIGQEEAGDPAFDCFGKSRSVYIQKTKAHSEFEEKVREIMHHENEPGFNAACAGPQQDVKQRQTGRFFIEEYAASVGLAGQSEATYNSLQMIKMVASSKCNPVLIVGETGTGKEPAARAIHTLRNPEEEFVAINCAALTANLLESELFGHTKGSFTGADRDKAGLLEMAGEGTVLLDEITEMPMELQAKLLRVLQEKSFRKVGGVKNIPCRATIIASSNRDLRKEVQANRFRHDLYYRLNICPIHLAPLRDPRRTDDIELLAEYFLETSDICPEKQSKIKGYTRLAVEALQNHNWPGNVRELRNVIERAVLLETTDKIGLSNIILESHGSLDYAQNQHRTRGQRIKDFSLAKAESELIARALEETGWQKTRAAALLGITRATLYAKVKQYNIRKTGRQTDQPEHATQNTPESVYAC